MIALRAHLDSSGKLKDSYITLAAFAGTDEMWGEFDATWQSILDNHTPRAKYIHMREIVHQTKGFDRKLGWDDDSAFGVANKCLVYMSNLDKKRFRMFYCAVDLQAWHKLKAETYLLPSPIELCNEYCSKAVLMWYMFMYPDVVNLQRDTIKYLFDRGEMFKGPFEATWNKEKHRAEQNGVWNIWKLVEQISAVDMKMMPGVQAADILAWAVNREQTAAAGKKGTMMRHIMMQVIPASSVVWDEAKLRKHFKPLLYLPRRR